MWARPTACTHTTQYSTAIQPGQAWPPGTTGLNSQTEREKMQVTEEDVWNSYRIHKRVTQLCHPGTDTYLGHKTIKKSKKMTFTKARGVMIWTGEGRWSCRGAGDAEHVQGPISWPAWGSHEALSKPLSKSGLLSNWSLKCTDFKNLLFLCK